MSLSRRHFVSSLAAALIGVRRMRRGRSDGAVYSMGRLRGTNVTPDIAAHQGATLGVSEANRTAELFGRSAVQLVEASNVTSLLRAPRLVALIGGTSAVEVSTMTAAASPRHVAVFNSGATDDALRASQCLPSLFHVAPSERMRRDARHQRGPEAAEVTAWHSSLEAFGAAQLNQRYLSLFDQPMTASAWTSWLAVKVITELVLRTHANDARALSTALLAADARFDGHKGQPLSFRIWDHQRRQPLYLVRETTAATPAVIEAPARGQSLDVLGVTIAQARCRFTPS